LKTDQLPTKHKSRWKTPGRWLFLVIVVASLAFVGMRIRDELRKADMSLQSTRLQTAGTTLSEMVINRQAFRTPRDSLLRTSQIAFALRVVYLHDTLSSQSASPAQAKRRMAVLFDTHMMSVEEYRWIRTTLLATLRNQGSTSVLLRQKDRLRVTEQLFRQRNGAIRTIPDMDQRPYGAGRD
jgi:hypothetical protein